MAPGRILGQGYNETSPRSTRDASQPEIREDFGGILNPCEIRSSSRPKGEAVLVSRLRAALERLNPALPAEAITAAVDELTRNLLLPHLLSGQCGVSVWLPARERDGRIWP